MANLISDITLCRVNITPKHQVNFANTTEQLEFFTSKAINTWNKCKYVARTGKIVVKGFVEQLRTCNYGFYTNEYNGHSKTFYFFIVQQKALAKETTELTIAIDLYQTWQFQHQFKTSFIERETVDNDTIGKHTLTEDFELGDYVCASEYHVNYLNDDVCYLLAVADIDSESYESHVYGDVYSGLEFYYYSGNDTKLLSKKIQSLCNNGKADAIAYITMYPSGYLSALFDNLTSGKVIPSYELKDFIITFQRGDINKFSLHGENYVIENNKMCCYPFRNITINSPNGSNVVLKNELFSGGDNANNVPTFRLYGNVGINPKFILTPRLYNGVELSYNDEIELQGFGLCSWVNDNFANWYAQNSNSIRTQSANALRSYNANSTVASNSYNANMFNAQATMGQGMINAVGQLGGLFSTQLVGAVTGAVATAGNSYVDFLKTENSLNTDLANTKLLNNTSYQNTIASLMATVSDARVQPNTAKGDTSTSGIDVARKTNTFIIREMTIKPEYAKMIDSYFKMYGYKVNRLGYPNLTSRNVFNYIKTAECNIIGTCPQEDLEGLKEIYNNGLTIWHNHDNIMNYTLPNDIKVVEE